MTKEKIDWRIIATGLICITALEICAILNGMNGTMLKIVIGIIGITIGTTIPNFVKK